MSEELKRVANRTVKNLEALARDLKHERPSTITPEESDKRVAAKLEQLARVLAAALEDQEAQ